MAMAPMMRLALKGRKPFCLAVSPAKQKMLSLRPRRLCGESSILDKYDIKKEVTCQFVMRED
jgi:hypothetical protein